MDRLLGRHPVLHIIWLNVYKIFFVALRIAYKVIDIRTLNNKNFASVGGITLRHLNEMEMRMLQDLHFDTYISPRDILGYAARAFEATTPHIDFIGVHVTDMTGMSPGRHAVRQWHSRQQRPVSFCAGLLFAIPLWKIRPRRCASRTAWTRARSASSSQLSKSLASTSAEVIMPCMPRWCRQPPSATTATATLTLIRTIPASSKQIISFG
jgi:hypothetical protein